MTTNRANINFLQAFHSVVRSVLELSGFEWELRRAGDARMGLWRRKLKPAQITAGRFVLIPGFGDTSAAWMTIVSALIPLLSRAGYSEIVVLDFPGYSGFLSEEKFYPSVDLLVSATQDVLDSLEPHTILGHSLGGWLTARYASDCGNGSRPKIQRKFGYTGPKKIFLISPAGGYLNENIRGNVEEVFKKMVNGEGLNAVRPHLFNQEPFWFKFLARDFNHFSSEENVKLFVESVTPEFGSADHLQFIQAKSWLIWGDKDTLTPTQSMPLWMSHLSKSPGGVPQAVVLKNVGHSPHIEAMPATLALLGQFLFEKSPHPRGDRWWRSVTSFEPNTTEI